MAIACDFGPFVDLSLIKPANLGLIDMNASSGGLARGASTSTSFQNIVNYSGKGYFAGCSIKIDSILNHYVRIVLDGVDVLISSSGLYLNDLDDIYGVSDATTAVISLGLFGGGATAGYAEAHGFKLQKGVFIYQPRSLMRFDATCLIQIRRSTGNSPYRGGLLSIIKD